MTYTSPNDLAQALRIASEWRVTHFFRPDGKAKLIPHVGGEQEFDRLLMVMDGVKREKMSIDNRVQSIALESGDVYLVGRGIWEYHDVTTAHKLLCVVPRHNFLRVSFYQFPAGLKRGDWVDAEAIHTGRPVPSTLRHIFAALTEEDPANIDCVRHLINAAASVAARETQCPKQSSGKALATFERVRNFIDNHYDQPINRESLAKTFHVHPNYLSTLFSENSGQSVRRYIESRRMTVAKDTLKNTDITIKEIADLAGFSSVVYFVRRFRELEGVPPGQYRARHTTVTVPSSVS